MNEDLPPKLRCNLSKAIINNKKVGFINNRLYKFPIKNS